MDLFKLSGKIVVDDAEAKKKIDGVTGTAKQAEGKMGSSFGKIGESVKKAFTVGAIVGFEKKVISTYKTYDDQMRKVQAVTDATGETYEKLRNKAEELGKSTRFSATEAGEGMEALGRAGWSADQIMAGIGETLTFATANTIELGEASSIVADGLSMFGMKAEETGRFTDVLSMTARESNTDIGLLGDTLKYVGPVAGSLGYELEDVSLAIGLMANEGIKGSQAGTALRSTITRMVSPTKESAEAMADLGIEMTDADGNMKPFKETLKDLRNAFGELTPEQKAQYAASIAGQQGMSGLLAVVNASDEDFNAMAEAIENSTGVTEDMANTMDSGLGGAIESVRSAWDNFLIQLGKIQDGLATAAIRLLAKAIEGLGDIVLAVNDVIQDFKQWLSENEQAAKILTAAMVAFGASLAIGPLISGLIGFLKLLGGGFISMIGAISPVNVAVAIFAGLAMAIYENWDEVTAWLTDMWENIKELFSTSVEFVSNVIDTGWEFIKEVFRSAIDFISNLIQSVWQPIAEFFTSVWETASNILAFIWEFITVTIENAITFVEAIIKTVLNIIKAIWQTIWNYIGDYVMTIWNKIKEVVQRSIDGIKTIIQTVMNVIKGIWSKVWGSIVNTTRTIWNNIKNTITPILNSIKDTITRVWNNVKQTTQNVWNNIKNVITNIINSIKNVVQSVFNNIKNIVTNIWNNIKSVTSNIWNGIKSTISNVINNIKSIVSNIFGNIANTARSRWQETRNNMVRPVEAARDKIKSALDKIKGFFSNLRLKFPKIEMPELPHFRLDGKFSLKPPSVPKLKVDWYKDGGILTDATIFGSQGDTLLGGGEAGAEAVLPIEKLGGIMADTMERLGYGNDNREKNITQNLTINTPKHLSPAETARENKKVLQRLALEL